jgi:predicted ABC-type transport system involved in lysophospholipase L1 biosynthesis ATPase subunit
MQDLEAIIRLRELRKIYQMGTQEVRALDGVDLDIKKKTSTLQSWVPQARVSQP